MAVERQWAELLLNVDADIAALGAKGLMLVLVGREVLGITKKTASAG